MRISLVLPAAALVAVLAHAGAAQAGTYGFGSIVGGRDNDMVPSAKAQAVTVCFVDDSGDALYNAGEPVFLHLVAASCAAPVKAKDLRLVVMEGLAHKPGSEVKGSDADFDLPLTGPLAHAVRWLDQDGDGKWNDKDALVLDLLYVGAPRLGPGDYRFTPQGNAVAGSVVRSSDPGVGSALAELGGTVTLLSDPDIFYKAGDAYYINTKKTAIPAAHPLVEKADVRVNDKAPDYDGLGSAAILVTSLEAEPDTPLAGAPYRLGIGVKNNGTAPGAGMVTTWLGDIIVDGRSTPWLGVGANATMVAMLVAPAEAGDHTLKVDGASIVIHVQPAPAAATPAQVGMAVQQARADLQQQVADLAAKVAGQEQDLASWRAMFASGGSAQPGGTVQVASEEAKPLDRAAPGADPLTLLAALGCAALFAVARRK